jgi:hypothetical protein
LFLIFSFKNFYFIFYFFILFFSCSHKRVFNNTVSNAKSEASVSTIHWRLGAILDEDGSYADALIKIFEGFLHFWSLAPVFLIFFYRFRQMVTNLGEPKDKWRVKNWQTQGTIIYCKFCHPWIALVLSSSSAILNPSGVIIIEMP